MEDDHMHTSSGQNCWYHSVNYAEAHGHWNNLRLTKVINKNLNQWKAHVAFEMWLKRII